MTGDSPAGSATPVSGSNWPARPPASRSSAIGFDRKFGTEPWGILGGVVIGLVGGLYNLVRESLQAAREAKTEDQLASDEGSGPEGRGGNGG